MGRGHGRGNAALLLRRGEPQGISAKSFCAILDETVSGASLEEVQRIPGDVVFDIYGKEISMGKGEGLLGILTSVQMFAREAAGRRRI